MAAPSTSPHPQGSEAIRAIATAAFWLLVPVWATSVVVSWTLGSEGIPLGTLLTDHPQPSNYPEVLASLNVQVRGSGEGPVRGDHLIRYGDADLRGFGPVAVVVREWRARKVVDGAFEMPLSYEHAGNEYRTTARIPRNPLVRWYIVMALIDGILALVVSLRAADQAAGRSYAAAALVHGIVYSSWGCLSDSEPLTCTAIVVNLIALTCLGPLALRCVLLVPKETAPRSRWPFWAVWAASLLSLGFWGYWIDLWDPHRFSSDSAFAITMLLAGGLVFLGLGIVARNYVRASPIGRRQLKWALFALAIAVPALATASVMAALQPGFYALAAPLHLASTLVPISVAIAIVRSNLFDIDRLISTAAAYGVLIFALLVAALLGLPLAAEVASVDLGVDPTSARVVFAFAIAALAILGQPYVRPWIERLFFKERFALERGIAGLLREIGGSESPSALLEHLSERLDALLRPETCVVYRRTDSGYAAVFSGGRSTTPEFPTGDPLTAALAHRARPLARERAIRLRAGFPLSPFDMAALETLRAAVVVPAVAKGVLEAFVSLGRKRSGDVYTSTDLALLAAVGDKLASELTRLAKVRAVEGSREGLPLPLLQRGGAAEAPLAIDEHVLRNEGTHWTMIYGGKAVRLKPTKGLHYLACLLQHPGREFLATELANGIGTLKAGGSASVLPHAEGIPVLDETAKRAYRERLEELRDDLEEAEAHNDLGRTQRLNAEMAMLTDQLHAAVGLGGRDRKTGGTAERARLLVTKRIKDTLRKIDAEHPPLGHHLRACVKTGYLCTYVAPPDSPIEWRIANTVSGHVVPDHTHA